MREGIRLPQKGGSARVEWLLYHVLLNTVSRYLLGLSGYIEAPYLDALCCAFADKLPQHGPHSFVGNPKRLGQLVDCPSVAVFDSSVSQCLLYSIYQIRVSYARQCTPPLEDRLNRIASPCATAHHL